MPYRIDPQISHQNLLRANAPELHYIKQLEERDRVLRLDNIVVDVEQLILRTFACDTAWCLRCKGQGAQKQYAGSCCTDLEVDLTDLEMERIERLGAMAHQKLSFSPRDPVGEVVQRIRERKIAERTDKGEMALRHIKSGRCSLSWMGPDGTLRCAINSLCERLGVPLFDYKAEPCYLFPLHYVEHLPGQYFVTVITAETIPFIGADGLVGRLRCLRRPKPLSPPAYVFLRGEISITFGEELYEAIDRAAQPFLAGDAAEGESELEATG